MEQNPLCGNTFFYLVLQTTSVLLEVFQWFSGNTVGNRMKRLIKMQTHKFKNKPRAVHKIILLSILKSTRLNKYYSSSVTSVFTFRIDRMIVSSTPPPCAPRKSLCSALRAHVCTIAHYVRAWNIHKKMCPHPLECPIALCNRVSC